jgi:aryl-alcohol dehydrogenase-like predicted oxidoreductase
MKFSRIQLGTVQFGLNYGIANTGSKPTYEQAREIVRTAVENGINCFDTAAAYGDSEEVLGRIIEELGLRGKVHIISKILPVSERSLTAREAEDFIRESVKNSLRRLRLDYLSAGLFHREEDIKYLPVLRQLETEGLLKGCGVSLDTAEYCDYVLANKVKFVQLPYNILDRRFNCFLSGAKKQNINIFARSLYLQGLLLMPEENIAESLREVIPVRRCLAELATGAGMSMPELCARFVLSNPAISSILTGVDNITQLKQNLQLLGKDPLPAELYHAVKAVVPTLEEEIVRPCRWILSEI